jgi:hypothetical protein
MVFVTERECVYCAVRTYSDYVCCRVFTIRSEWGTQAGQDSSMGIVTCYGLDGPGIESW